MNTKIIQKGIKVLALTLMIMGSVNVAHAESNVGNFEGSRSDPNETFVGGRGPNVESTGVNSDVNVGDSGEAVPDLPAPSIPQAPKVQQPLEFLNSSIGKQSSELNKFDGRFHPLSAVDPGADIITSIIYTVIDFLKYFLGGAATLLAIIQGLKLVTAGRKIDDIQPKAVNTLKYMVYGFVFVMVADQIVSAFYGEVGACAASSEQAKECGKTGSILIKGIYDFILSIIATLAIFSIAFAGFRMVTAAGNDDTVGASKKRITYAIVGLLVAGIGEFVVRGVVFPDNGEKGIDYAAAQHLVITFTNYISSFIGAGAFIMLFYGGYLYAVSFGEDDQVGKAKKIMTSALIGILIAAAAFGVIRTITTFQSTSDLNLPTNIPGVTQNP